MYLLNKIYMGLVIVATGPELCQNVIFPDFLFVCFVVLRPKSTAKVMAGRSVHLTTL